MSTSVDSTSRITTNVRLSTMMFIEFFVWGTWYVTIGNYMAAHGMGDLIHWPYTMNAVAAIVAPFFVGLIADRYFATEKVFAALHLLGGVIMFMVPQTSGSPALFIGLMLAYNLCFMPTMALANSLSFHNITDQEKQFPLIRVFGTIGWIVAGLFISVVLGAMVTGRLPDVTPLPLYTTAVGSILLGLYAFTLPHTPPPARGEKVSVRSIVGVDALKQLGSPSFYIFIISSLLISIPLAAYYNFSPVYIKNALYDTGLDQFAPFSQWVLGSVFTGPASLLSLGQMSEVLFMLLMPFFFRRLGVKWMMVAGMAMWVIRYALFAAGAPNAVFWMIVVGILLHGGCYDFFFVTGQIYVDKKSTPEIRGQAQGFLVLVTYGIGLGLGAQIAGYVNNALKGTGATPTLEQWQEFWIIPAIFAAAVMVFFTFTFRDRVLPDKEKAVDDQDLATASAETTEQLPQ